MKNLQHHILATTNNPLERANEVLMTLGEALQESAFILWVTAILVLFIYRIFFRTRNKR